jgi:3-oxoadipate enol-lactonase
VLYYEVRGPADTERAPIVLLHGLGSSSADWDSQIPAFAASFRVVMIDLPGHGRSRGRRPLTIAAMAREVEHLLDHLRLPPSHVVGVSLGGCVALALALAAPARVRSLTLVNAFARLSPAGWRGATRMLWRVGLVLSAPMPTVATHVARGLFPKPTQHALRAAAAARLGQTARRTYLAGMRAIGGFDVRDRLDRIACPTLVLAGDCDATVPLSAKERLRAGIPGARLLVVADSGHAMHYDQPEAFNRAVLEFLEAH